MFHCLWWSIATLTTVDYGDVYIKHRGISLAKREIESYKEKIVRDPNDVGLYIGLAHYYLKLDLYKEAIDCYKTALWLSPNNAEIISCLGDTYLDYGSISEAIELYEKIRNTPTDEINNEFMLSDCLASLGECYNKIDLHEKAIEVYNEVLIIDPNMEYAHHLLAKSFINFRAPDLA